MKSRKLSPEDSPSPLLYKPSQRARRDLSDSDQEADLDASDKDFVTNKKNLGRLQRGVKPQTKKKAKKEGKSPWVIAGNEESSESEDKEIVIQDSPEPIEVKPAMRVNIHANKDCKFLSTISSNDILHLLGDLRSMSMWIVVLLYPSLLLCFSYANFTFNHIIR